MRHRTFLTACCSVFAAQAALHAEVTLPALISDNMVLQQRTKASVWGTAEPQEKVTVTVAAKTATTTAGDDGKWSVKLDGLRAGGPFEMKVSGKNTITVKNVAVGEVWVGSGQSNMEWKVANSDNAEKEATSANFPMIRMFTVTRKVADEPQTDVQGKWEVCDPQTVRGFSAVGYFFSRELHQKLKIPIGVIHSSWGGTPAQAWTPKAELEKDAELKPILDDWQSVVEKHPEAKAAYDQQLAAWNAEAEKAKAAGQSTPRRPSGPPRGPGDSWAPAGLFNGMIAPLTSYTIRGVVWYQGESNATNAKQYRKLFPTMIAAWRKAWGLGDLPFLYVQLANFMARLPEPSESNWAELREAQLMTLKLPKTGMAVAIDIGDEKDLHPRNKQEVGRRLALNALATVYGREDVTPSGPMYAGMKIERDKVRLSFKQLGGGLVDKDGPPLKGFAIAGEDRRFVWAEAKIEGNAVVVRSNNVSEPVAVRYAWAGTPDCDLYNKAGLPASPFRTDNWERQNIAPAVPSPSATSEPSATPSPAP